MQAFTIENDKAVRAILTATAGEFRKRYNGTAYQGDYENTTTGETFGDRLQVPTTYTTKNGVRYLLVLNLLVERSTGGKLSARVSAWRMTSNGIMGTWVVTASDTTRKAKGDIPQGWLLNTSLTAQGFVERIGNSRVHFDIVRRLPNVLAGAKALLDADTIGNPVQVLHGYAPSNPLFGETYDTAESHLLPFGGIAGALTRLNK